MTVRALPLSTSTRSVERRRVGRLIALLGGSGAVHLLAPQVYERIIPPALGNARRWVVWSGYAELACAALLAAPSTRRAGGYAGAALFVAVFPANVYALTITGGNPLARAGTIARLPLQIPMIVAALKVARDNGTGGLTPRP